MGTEEFNKDGLYYRYWAAPAKTKAVVVLVHGLGEHCQRYEHLAQRLNQAGYALSSMDLPGHGQSQGERGHIDSFDQFQNAIVELTRQTKIKYPEKPIVLLGHSMGGLVATQVLLNHQDSFAAAMLSGAAIQSPQEPPGWQVVLIKTIAKFLPKAKMLALDASGISRDPSVVEKYMSDPLVSQEKLSARFLVGMTQAMELCKNQANSITLPMLVMHGSADVMTSPQGSQLLFEQLRSQDKQLKIYNDLFHEIFNEPEAENIFTEMIDWMSSRV